MGSELGPGASEMSSRGELGMAGDDISTSCWRAAMDGIDVKLGLGLPVTRPFRGVVGPREPGLDTLLISRVTLPPLPSILRRDIAGCAIELFPPPTDVMVVLADCWSCQACVTMMDQNLPP